MSFTIGCDPELILRQDECFVSASKFFKARSSMGLDGCDSVAEIRPGYAESPIDLTAKIKIILEYGYEKAPECEFLAGHYQFDYPIGGHIHFGITSDLRFIDALDTILGSLSNAIDDKEQRGKRQKTGYGKIGSYRKKDYGFEYRFPGSFLLSPSITLVTFTLAKLAIVNVQENNINFKDLRQRQHSKTFLKRFKDYITIIPEDCEEGLRQLDLLLQRRIDWYEDILPNWGIAQERRIAA